MKTKLPKTAHFFRVLFHRAKTMLGQHVQEGCTYRAWQTLGAQDNQQIEVVYVDGKKGLLVAKLSSADHYVAFSGDMAVWFGCLCAEEKEFTFALAEPAETTFERYAKQHCLDRLSVKEKCEALHQRYPKMNFFNWRE